MTNEMQLINYALSHKYASVGSVSIQSVLDATLSELDSLFSEIQSSAAERDFLATTHWGLVSLRD